MRDFGPTLSVIVIAVLWFLYERFEARELERRLTAPSRARRATQNLVIDHIAAVAAHHPAYEQWLRLMLLDDLRQILARREAAAWIREQYGIEVDVP